MDGTRFDDLLRSLARSRRAMLGGCLVLATGWLGTSRSDARKKRKHKPRPKPAEPNAFGCLNVGDPCQSAEQCCSSICKGKRGKRTCRAHDANGCSADTASEVCGITAEECTTSFQEPGSCGATTGNAGYCYSFGGCYPCATDAECQQAGGGLLGPYAACIRCTNCTDTGGTACVGPFKTAGATPGFGHDALHGDAKGKVRR